MTGPPPDLSRSLQITWWGHATASIDLAGVRVLTDPIFAARLAHLRRLGGPLPAPAARQADLVVISHLHRDHLHLPSLASLPPGTRIIGPRGSAAVAGRPEPGLADRIEEVTAGDQVTVGGLQVQAVPAEHDGRRAPGSRFRGTALGYLLRPRAGTGPSVWFAGDTGLFDGLTEIGPVDLAVVPVGGWGPTLGPGHLDPGQAAEAVRRVAAGHAVPIHYGTFWPVGLRRLRPATFGRLFDQPGVRFSHELAALTGARCHLLAPGQTSRTAIGRA
ncbi:MAG: MBL fold metallo-hydrolase [Jatrophihabitans sp.]